MAENPGSSIQSHQPSIEPTNVFDDDGHVVSGTKLTGKAELLRLLKDWLQLSGAATVGNIGTFGRRPCVFIALEGGLTAVLNSDTKRAAIQEFVKNADECGSDAPWSVVANKLGPLNKLVFRPDGTATPGWYCYLREPLTAPRKV